MSRNYNLPLQVADQVNQIPLCLMFIDLDGKDIYYINMSGELTLDEQKFLKYIGRPEPNPPHRNKWRRSIDVANYFIDLIKRTDFEHDDFEDDAEYLQRYDESFTIQLLKNINTAENRSRWQVDLDREDLNDITGDGRNPLHIIVVNDAS
jgi:hypothetical protein